MATSAIRERSSIVFPTTEKTTNHHDKANQVALDLLRDCSDQKNKIAKRIKSGDPCGLICCILHLIVVIVVLAVVLSRR